MKIRRSKDIAGQGSKDSTFVIVRSMPERFYLSRTGEGKILFHKEGSIRLNVEKKGEIDIAPGKMVFIPPLSNFTIHVRAESLFYLYRISIQRHFTESCLPLHFLYEWGKVSEDDDPCHLDAHTTISRFFHAISVYIEDEVKAHMLYTHKARELLLLMRNYYNPRELAAFFRPIIDRDHEFSDFVMQNYRRYRTVQELADASCHSLSSFNRLFRKNFGSAPYTWMKQQRANDICRDLTTTNIPIKKLCADHGFSSLSQFTTFCKRHLGVSPRRMRELHMATEAKELI